MGGPKRSWRNSTVLGFSLASFLSDASHEMATAVLPLYLRHLGLGASVLGLIEGVADLSGSGSKWLAGSVGQRTRHKKTMTATAYAVTAVCVGAFSLVTRVLPFLILRAVAWASRGFRGPLRDTMLAESVDPENYGKAYGLERAGDMAGAVVGPLAAVGLLAIGTSLPRIFLLDHAGRVWAYGTAAAFSAAGVLTLAAVIRRSRNAGRAQDRAGDLHNGTR